MSTPQELGIDCYCKCCGQACSCDEGCDQKICATCGKPAVSGTSCCLPHAAIQSMPSYNCPACFKGPRGLVTSVDITREEVFQDALNMGPWVVTTVQEVGGMIQMLLLTCDQCGYQTHCEPFSEGVHSVSGSTSAPESLGSNLGERANIVDRIHITPHRDDGCGAIDCEHILHHAGHQLTCKSCSDAGYPQAVAGISKEKD